MAKTIKYIGSQDPWPELSITGKQSVWHAGQTEIRLNHEAEALLLQNTFALVSADAETPATVTNVFTRVFTIPDGSVLRLTPGSSTTATAQLLNTAIPGINPTVTTPISTEPVTMGPYMGTQKILVTTTAGSIDAVVADAAPVIQAHSTGGNRVALSGDSISQQNYIVTQIASWSRSNNVVTIVLTGTPLWWADYMVYLTGVPSDIRGRQKITGGSGTSWTFANAGPDVASGTLGSFPRVANLGSFADSGWFVRMNIASGQKFDVVACTAATGAYVSDWLADQLPELLATQCEFVQVQVGTNDCGATEATKPLALSISSYLSGLQQILSAGKSLIVGTVPAMGAAAWSADKDQRILTFNKALEDFARSNSGRIFLVPCYRVTTDRTAANKGQAKTNYIASADGTGLHLSPDGAKNVGDAGAAVTASVPFVDIRTMSNSDNWTVNNTNTNIMAFAPWLNTTVAATSPATGVVATGSLGTRKGAASAVYSVNTHIENGQQIGYENQVVCTGTGTAGDGFSLNTGSASIHARVPANNLTQMDVTLAVSGLAGSGCQVNAYVSMVIDGVSNRLLNALAATSTVASEQVQSDWTGVLRTPRMPLPSGARLTNLYTIEAEGTLMAGAAANPVTVKQSVHGVRVA